MRYEEHPMYEITLISTRHGKIGECNSEALLKIFEDIEPEVIFEEKPLSCFARYYTEKTDSSLETEAISAYLENNTAHQVLIDSEDRPGKAFFKGYDRALENVERLTGMHGFDYRTLLDKNRRNMATYGFDYLNSSNIIEYHELISTAVEKALEQINDEKLSQSHKFWNELNDRRENEMLQNIYDYSKDNSYSKAVFLLGVGHRKSIINKINNWVDKFEINWMHLYE